MAESKKKDSQAQSSTTKSRKKRRFPRWLKLALVTIIMTVPVMIIAVILEYRTSQRIDVDASISDRTSYNVGGAVRQSGPSLNPISSDSLVYEAFSLQLEDEYGYALTEEIAEEYVQNTNLISTEGDVILNLDLVKRGLAFVPTYSTEFSAQYVLENTSDEEVAVEFEFPFPSNIRSKEITGAMLLVDGVEQENPARTETTTTYDYNGYGYDDYGYYEEWQPSPTTEEITTKTGLYWEGTIDAGGTKDVEVRYHTVGLGQFSYEGLENPEGSQDFTFSVKVLGTRKYNNAGILTIDDKEYINEGEKNGVILTWEKPDLFSTPNIEISIAPRVDASEHLYEIYKIMVPLYLVFSLSVIFLVSMMKVEFGGVDMMILALLFTVFFPFLHYLVSFNIDPSADVLINYAGVIDFSMPLYGAFAIAIGVVGGLMMYLFARVSGGKFALGAGLPMILVYMAFFPLAMTLPEYKYLLALTGVVAILGVFVQLRVSRKITRIKEA